jgi:5-formyltetrahydrofolate cyclo-ligase
MVDPGTLTGPALHDAKRELRARIVAARDAMPAAARAAAACGISARIAALPGFRAARCVLLNVAFRSEWSTAALLDVALAGKTVALPRVNAEQRVLELFVIRDLARDTAPGYRGIVEPHASLPRIAAADVDWVLVPGVAFDLDGRRLGYGGGYYDRLLAALPARTVRVAGAYDLQVVREVPSARHDLVVDTLATESRLLTFAR